MKRLLFIYNPRAGRQKARSGLADMLDVFAAQGYEITAHPTQSQGDATCAAAGSQGYDRVVCCGGDGTFNETVTGLMTIPKEHCVGLYPHRLYQRFCPKHQPATGHGPDGPGGLRRRTSCL